MPTITFDSPFGIFAVTGDDERGIFSIQKVERHESSIEAEGILQACKAQLLEYFSGQRKKFELPLNFDGAPPFHQLVWQQLLQIPYGSTSSYSAIARRLNQPNASQAVGLANKMNRFAIIVPCHRVVGKNGNLTGYFYGLEVKRRLLHLENPLKYIIQEELDFQ